MEPHKLKSEGIHKPSGFLSEGIPPPQKNKKKERPEPSLRGSEDRLRRLHPSGRRLRIGATPPTRSDTNPKAPCSVIAYAWALIEVNRSELSSYMQPPVTRRVQTPETRIFISAWRWQLCLLGEMSVYVVVANKVMFTMSHIMIKELGLAVHDRYCSEPQFLDHVLCPSGEKT